MTAKNGKSHWANQSVAESIELLLSVLRKHHPELCWKTGPANQKQIQLLRREIQYAPIQFFELLEIVDYTDTRFFKYLDLISLEELPNASARQFETYAEFAPVDDDEDGWFPTKYDCCRHDKRWRLAWIPIAELNGDPIFLDMEPSEHGHPGQVVRTDSDGWSLHIQGYSISHWFQRMAENIDLEPAYYDPLVFTPLPPPSQ